MSEISQNELFILDPEVITKDTVGTSPGMVDTVGEDLNSSDQLASPGSHAAIQTLYRYYMRSHMII